MPRVPRWLFAGAAVLLLAAAPVDAQIRNPSQPTPTTLYFHVFDTFNVFPINTQPMDVSFFEVGGTSFPTIASQGYDFNTIYGFSSAGPVEYNFIENGRPRFHPERGIAANVDIDPNTVPTAHIYLDVRDFFSTDTHPQNLTGTPADDVLNQAMDAWGGLPQLLPMFTVRVTMRAGNQFGPNDNLDAGQLIMQGQLTAHAFDGGALPVNSLVAGQTDPNGVPVFVPDETGVVEFAVPMEIATAGIPKVDAYNIRIDWYQNPTGDAASDDQYAEGWMRLVSDAQHQPRLDLAILKPVYIEYIHPEVAAGILLIHTCVNSPWGTYDVDVHNITMTVTGPSTPKTLQQVTSQNSHVHNLHDKCAEVTYLWRFRDEDARSGDYQIHLAVQNNAHTGTATGDAGFTIEGKRAFGVDASGNTVAPVAGEGDKKSPGAGPLVGLVLLATALLVRRRWP